MSVNLHLGLDRYGGDPVLCYERHRLAWQDAALFAALKSESVPLPDGAQWYFDEGLEHVREDAYGEPLKWLTAHAVVRRLSEVPLRGWDAAVLQLLKALPPSTRVVLYWA